MVATRVVLDRKHPCLACGAPWRALHTARVSGRPADAVAVWEAQEGSCAVECWHEDTQAHERGLLERAARGWPF